jgi:hypothetical protein
VAYSDYGDSLKATVMTFNGTNWVNVGNTDFSEGEAYWISLAFSPSNNQPYVAYADSSNSYEATVMKFNGTNWMNVGNIGFSGTGYESLAFNLSDGEPYVAFTDGENSDEGTVMKFNGTNWVNVGNAVFSAGEALCTSLAFSPSDGEPFVAYSDGADSGKATVMHYDSVFVGINEPKESRLSLYPNPATDKITVELSGATQSGNLTIVDIEGQELITRQSNESKILFDISNLTSGVYFVRLTNDKIVDVGKFIKQ